MKPGSDSGMCKHINWQTKHQKIAPKLSLSKNDEIPAEKTIEINSWKALENLDTDTESKEPKSRTKKYGETRAAA